MNGIDATLVMATLFALRCVAPLAITAGLGYLMNRLVDHWEAEEALEPAPDVALAPAGRVERKKPQPVLSMLSVPCWITNSCPEEKRKRCPACQRNDVPCWQARLEAEGVLPAGCPDCPRYRAGQVALA